MDPSEILPLCFFNLRQLYLNDTTHVKMFSHKSKYSQLSEEKRPLFHCAKWYSRGYGYGGKVRERFCSVTSALEPATQLRVHPQSCWITSIIAGKQWELLHLLFWAAFMSLECRQVCHYSIRCTLLACILSSPQQEGVGAMRDRSNFREIHSLYLELIGK